MDLFSTEPTHNILPYDGVVNYYGIIFPATTAQQLFTTLLNTIAFKNDEAIVFGKHIVTKRKVAWYGDTPYFYHYSGHTKQALVWTPELLELKTEIEKISGATYNSCLINLYHNGNEGVSWHSDDEKTLKKHAPIAAVSLGAERKFSFKHKQNKQTLSIFLQNGSLLVMKDSTQTHWLHALPKSTRVTQARISLTFRTIVNQNE